MTKIVTVSTAWREGARLLRAALDALGSASRAGALQDPALTAGWLAVAGDLAREAGEQLGTASGSVQTVSETDNSKQADTAR